MKFAMCLETEPSVKWAYARQLGLAHGVVVGPPSSDWPLWDFRRLLALKKSFEDAEIELIGIEGLVPMDHIKSGGPDRDAQIEQLCQVIRNMGALEIPVLCYNWMAFIPWARTSTTTRARGGALTLSYEHELASRVPSGQLPRISQEELWKHFEYFLGKVVPVAEAAKVRLALHPDDPPLSPVMGVARIFGSTASFDRALALIESPANSLCFCQANFSLMDGPARVPDLIRHYGDRIAFVHFRDVRGTAESFVETFHDEGHTDMLACMHAYREIGFEGPIRPDHAPWMEGDTHLRPGYDALGRLFAFGYMRGLLEGVDAARRSSAIR